MTKINKFNAEVERITQLISQEQEFRCLVTPVLNEGAPCFPLATDVKKIVHFVLSHMKQEKED